MSSFNSTFVTELHRNMNCPVCGVTLSVNKRINGSAEASRNQLRVDMVAHLKANHDTFQGRKFLAKFGGDVLAPAADAPKIDDNAIRAIVGRAVADEFSKRGSGIDTDALRSIVRKELDRIAQANTLTVVHAGSKVPVSIRSYHVMLKETIRTVNAGFKNVLLVGSAGTGKSAIAEQLSTALKTEFGFLSLSGGTTEGQLLGRLTSDGRYLPSEFVRLYEEGGVFLLDEVDAADPNVLLVLNSALANGHLAVPARVKKQSARRHPDFILICAANTWGTGADWQYVGRNQLDAAFLSRFAGAVVEVGYDEALERSLTTESWFELFIAVRKNCMTNKIRRVMGTRELLAGERLLKAGYTPSDTWSRLTAGWSADERRKAGVPSNA